MVMVTVRLMVTTRCKAVQLYQYFVVVRIVVVRIVTTMVTG